MVPEMQYWRPKTDEGGAVPMFLNAWTARDETMTCRRAV
jgi:hypothetical protein